MIFVGHCSNNSVYFTGTVRTSLCFQHYQSLNISVRELILLLITEKSRSLEDVNFSGD